MQKPISTSVLSRAESSHNDRWKCHWRKHTRHFEATHRGCHKARVPHRGCHIEDAIRRALVTLCSEKQSDWLRLCSVARGEKIRVQYNGKPFLSAKRGRHNVLQPSYLTNQPTNQPTHISRQKKPRYVPIRIGPRGHSSGHFLHSRICQSKTAFSD